MTFNNSAQQLRVPVKAHLVVDSRGKTDYTTDRHSWDVVELFDKANKIWAQANISLLLSGEIGHTSITSGFDSDVKAVHHSVLVDLIRHQNWSHIQANVFFVNMAKNQEGEAVNGCHVEIKGRTWLKWFVLVSDKPMDVPGRPLVNSHRTLAHEMGHAFGLPHVGDTERLMASGENGEVLDEAEIAVARGVVSQKWRQA